MSVHIIKYVELIGNMEKYSYCRSKKSFERTALMQIPFCIKFIQINIGNILFKLLPVGIVKISFFSLLIPKFSENCKKVIQDWKNIRY